MINDQANEFARSEAKLEQEMHTKLNEFVEHKQQIETMLADHAIRMAEFRREASALANQSLQALGSSTGENLPAFALPIRKICDDSKYDKLYSRNQYPNDPLIVLQSAVVNHKNAHKQYHHIIPTHSVYIIRRIFQIATDYLFFESIKWHFRS